MQTPAEQTVLIEQLRQRVGVLPEDIVVAGDQTAALRRFIVARKGDVDKAEEQLRRALEWRDKGYGVLRLLAKPPRKRLDLVRALMPSNPHLAFSKAGFPVSLTSLGGADLVAISRDITPEDATSDFVVRAEFYRAVVFPEASRRAVDKEVVMLDVGGLSLGLLKVMPLFKVVNAIGSSYFPERTINILVLNAPRVFQQLWAILQKLVDPRTQKKVHILSGGEHQLTVLRTFLEDADIPESLGGKRPPPFLSGSDAQATAAVYGRLDQWLAEQHDPAAPSPPSKPSLQTPPPPSPLPPSPAAQAPTPAPPQLEQCSADVAAPLASKPESAVTSLAAAPSVAPAAAQPERAVPPLAKAPSSGSSGKLTPQPSASASRPQAAPGDALAEQASLGAGVRSSKPGARDLEVAEPARPGELRDWLVLVLLWIATSLTFSLLVWGAASGGSRRTSRPE